MPDQRTARGAQRFMARRSRSDSGCGIAVQSLPAGLESARIPNLTDGTKDVQHHDTRQGSLAATSMETIGVKPKLRAAERVNEIAQTPGLHDAPEHCLPSASGRGISSGRRVSYPRPS